jgi:hypothetical protein
LTDPSSTNQSNADYKRNVDPQTLTTNTTSTFTFTVPDSWGKIDELTGSPYRSQAWNSGYSDGFFGYDLEGHHTKDFFYGYENGSQNFQWDRGYADGLSGKPLHPPLWSGILARKYYGGNNTGTQDRGWMSGDARGLYAPLPADTNDNYMHYYVGFDNGALATDMENHFSTTYYHGGCPADKTEEYCTGFKAGWNYEANIDWR